MPENANIKKMEQLAITANIVFFFNLLEVCTTAYHVISRTGEPGIDSHEIYNNIY